MKTIKPIKELISFRMDENKIWWMDYDWSGWFGSISRKHYREYDCEITHFLEKENNFTILPESYYVNSPHPYLPYIIFPKGILRELGSFIYDYEITQFGFRKSYPNQGSPSPYYGNPHYKKYIEDNNGECPLPFPKDVKWWELP